MNCSARRVQVVCKTAVDSALMPRPRTSVFSSITGTLNGSRTTTHHIVLGPGLTGKFGSNGPIRVRRRSAGRSTYNYNGRTKTYNYSRRRSSNVTLGTVSSVNQTATTSIGRTLRRIVSPRLNVSIVSLKLICNVRVSRLNHTVVAVALAAPTYPLASLVRSRYTDALTNLIRRFHVS